ncbi:TatD family hydrolase [Ravibacter arvi]|uniref:TatD family hydrolase n=1 Tax=Ravibacter arvi TaxID=2051041 RepID=A0ABP8LSR2_9BACT
MIETHAHIYDQQYLDDLDEMLHRAWQAGVTEIWMPNCDDATIGPMLEIADANPGKCLPMIGLHPCYVNDRFESQIRVVEEWLGKRKFIAIGEIGMDLFWDKTYRQEQEAAFLYQCELALQHHLWIDIHSREAFHETVKLIEKVGNPALTGIFHCFTGNLDEARIAIDLGFKLGIGGVATFKNGGLDAVLPHIDPVHVVLETDSPYLAPVPLRGKRNEVAYIDLVAQRVADLMQMKKEDLIRQTTANARSLQRA